MWGTLEVVRRGIETRHVSYGRKPSGVRRNTRLVDLGALGATGDPAAGAARTRSGKSMTSDCRPEYAPWP